MDKNHAFSSAFQLWRYNSVAELAEGVAKFDPARVSIPVEKKVIGLLFDEPSSRTRFSTESAAYRLKTNCIVSLSMAETSVAKGESYVDSAKVWSRCCDLLCVRHRLAGFARLLSEHTEVPVINLGDGFLEHPTQGLATLVHALQEFGTVRDLNICIWGDIAYSRTAHSVMIAFALLGANVWLHPRPAGELPNDLIFLINELEPRAKIQVVEELSASQRRYQILYVNRLQAERRPDNLNVRYGPLDVSDLGVLTPDGILLHPLPRGKELPDSVCDDPRVKIWKHVDITYRTRQWLLYQYLSRWEDKSVEEFQGFPLLLGSLCGRQDCASRLFPFMQDVSKPSDKMTPTICRACLRAM